MCLSPEALKVLRTSEFLPYVVFIEAPDYEVLKAMNRSAIESGVVTKQLTVSACSFETLETHCSLISELNKDISAKFWIFLEFHYR